MAEYDIRIKFKELAASDGNFRLEDPVFFGALKRALRKAGARQWKAGELAVLKRSFDFRPGREPALELKIRIGEVQAAADASVANVQAYRTAEPPVVVGFGPAGIFCGLTLARAGLRPVILERGDDIDRRTEKVRNFWDTGRLDPDTNVQFGEGGAGAYSDGKLTTLVKEKHRLGRDVLETFVEFGAPGDILIDPHPHIGTDLLKIIIKNIRNEIVRLGGTVIFGAKVTGFLQSGGRVSGVVYETVGGRTSVDADAVFLAIGHGARDTFGMLRDNGVSLSPKPMAVGLRIEHPQALIDSIQYGEYAPMLSKNYPAIYKLSSRLAKTAPGPGNGSSGSGGLRSVFTFCMCPGGFVVNASSEPGGLVTNGMSYSARDGVNANSALLVGVGPEDYLPYGSGVNDPLAGVAFQRHFERKAFELTNSTGKLPMQRLKDFGESVFKRYGREISELKKSGDLSLGLPCRRESAGRFYDNFTNQTCGAAEEADIAGLYPPFITLSILNGISEFDGRMAGFGDPDTILTAPETRSSSPVRIDRDPGTFESVSMKSLYPVGEGAGYAGGITSSGIDGIRAAGSYLSKLTDNDPHRS